MSGLYVDVRLPLVVSARLSAGIYLSRGFLRLKHYFEYRAPSQTPPVAFGQSAAV